jgi:hypothetical protein
MNLITVENNRAELVGSNFWQSDYSRAGYYYLSVNAGALRLLVPPSRLPELLDMRAAQEVIITRGPHLEHRGRPMLELLFDDHTSQPFALYLSIEQTDRRFADAGDLPRRFLIYTAPSELAGELTWYYREDALPCLRPLI